MTGSAQVSSRIAVGATALSRRGLLVGGAAAAGLAASTLARIAAAQGLTEVRMVGFSGATNLPVWFAIDRGLFEKEGLKVTLDRTPNSKEQIANMMAGTYQFATTAFDNIVAHTEGEGSAKYDHFDLVAILGVHSGLNSVVAAPAIKTWSDMKGKTVAVDAPTSGYATVLYQILQNKGLARDRDYKVLSVGGTGERVKALEEGTAQMAIISSPADRQLQNAGFNILADAAVEVGDYQGSTYAVRRSYAKANEKVVLAFIRAVRASHDAVFKNKADAIAVLKSRLGDLTDQQAEALYTRLIGPGGLNRGAALNTKGVETVLKLRSIYGGAKGPLPSPSKYIDTSYAARAR
jgi:ABC-type nitrate/sulfonate/bicarbonate transport system substrate-binding protein